MNRGPQYIRSIRKRVHNTLVNTENVHNISVQYGNGPQYISSIQKSVHNTLVQYGKKVHNILVQCGKRSTIYKFNTEKGPQYISQYGKCLQYIIQCGKGSTIY